MRKLGIVIIMGLLASGPVCAQSVSREAIDEAAQTCRTIGVEAIRAACLQAAEDLLAPAQPSNNADTSETPEDISTAATAAELQQLANARASLEEERLAFEQAQAAAAAAEAEADTETERRGLLARLGLGSENDTEELAATLTIERITVNRNGKHRFYTSEGDVLLETPAGRRLKLPRTLPATATLERRSFGGKWLIFEENPKRGIKVSIPRAN